MTDILLFSSFSLVEFADKSLDMFRVGIPVDLDIQVMQNHKERLCHIM